MSQEHIQLVNKTVKLKLSMSVTVEIKTGTRRLIEFLLAPLVKEISERCQFYLSGDLRLLISR